MTAALLFSACSSKPTATVTDLADSVERDIPSTPSSIVDAQQEASIDASVDSDTPASTPETQQEEFLFFTLEPDATWRDVYDNLTSPEQSCIREALGGELRESAMAMPVFEIFEETTPRQWEVPMISCLLPESAQLVFIPRLMWFIDEAFRQVIGIETTIEEFTCMRNRIHHIGIEAIIAAFTEGDDAAAIELIFGMFTCVPESIFNLVGEGAEFELRELNDDERQCVQEWIEGMDASDLQFLIAAEDDLATVLDFSFGMIACVPDVLVYSIGSELGVELPALDEDEKACVRDWIAGLGNDHWEAMAAEDDTEAITRLGIDMFICLPFLFSTAVSEEFGLELEELSESERSCLRDWMKGLDDEDLTGLVTGDDDARAVELYLGLFTCLPNVLLSVYAEETGIDLPATSEEEKNCLQDWIEDLDADLLAQVAEDDTEVIAGLGLGLVSCLPGVFVSAFAAGIGVKPPVLTEGEKACLQDWIEDLDIEGLMLMMLPENDPAAALQLGIDMLICVPELLPPGFAEDRIEESV